MKVDLHWLLISAAFCEAAMGLALIVAPTLVARLLLGEELGGAGLAVGRVAGFALVAFGVACWPRARSNRDEHIQLTQALRGMLIYNLLITVYLIGWGATSQSVGLLLWPGVALHSVFTLLFARELVRR